MVNISVATWNTPCATLSNERSRGLRIASVLEAIGADVVVVTEGVRELLPAGGSTVDAGDNWGNGPKSSQRKVVVWSRFPLSCDRVGDNGATRGRLAVATATTPAGPVRIVGVCIPWRGAHVTAGRGDAELWSEHLDFLDQFEDLLSEFNDAVPTVIAGDFNQRVPRYREPVRVSERVRGILAAWTIHTSGVLPHGPHTDHIVTGRGLALQSVEDWSASDHLGRLSDHAGVICRLAVTGGTVGEAARAEAATDLVQAEQDTNTAAAENSPGRFDIAGSGLVLTPQLRVEIERVLRCAPDGFEHGVGFRLREEGLTDAEIINKSSGIGTSRRWLNSLDRLLSGTLPTSKSAAKDTSYAYRELFNHRRSDDLDRYARAWLHELKASYPDDISFEPLNTRTHQYRVGKARKQRPVEMPCPTCAAKGEFHAGSC